MQRRTLLASGGAAGITLTGMPSASAQSASRGAPRSLIEVRKVLFLNIRENKRAAYVRFLETAYAPALKRAGVEAMGFFNNDIGPDKPHVLCLLSYPSAGAMIEVQEKLGVDKAYQSALNEVHGKGPVYERIESSLFRAFATVPKVEVPKGEGPLHFELRTYESDDPVSLAKKIGMFEEGGEIAIFRKYGLMPVFFGEAVVGDRMPNLTNMVAFPNAASRADAWRKFATSPEWDKLKRTPGLSDGEVVSSITNATYSGLPFSPIR
jgi:hypothetical protein